MFIAEINYSITAESLQPANQLRYSPVKGVLNSAIVHFPPGTNSLVEVFVYIGTVQVLPTPTTGDTQGNIGIRLHATTQSFNINIPIEQGDPLMVLVNNHDEDNPHTISVILMIEAELSYTGP